MLLDGQTLSIEHWDAFFDALLRRSGLSIEHWDILLNALRRSDFIY